jgi:hypothetical protein
MYKLCSLCQDMLEMSNRCCVPPLSIRSMVRFVNMGITSDVIAGEEKLHYDLRSRIVIVKLFFVKQLRRKNSPKEYFTDCQNSSSTENCSLS